MSRIEASSTSMSCTDCNMLSDDISSYRYVALPGCEPGLTVGSSWKHCCTSCIYCPSLCRPLCSSSSPGSRHNFSSRGRGRFRQTELSDSGSSWSWCSISEVCGRTPSTELQLDPLLSSILSEWVRVFTFCKLLQLTVEQDTCHPNSSWYFWIYLSSSSRWSSQQSPTRRPFRRQRQRQIPQTRSYIYHFPPIHNHRRQLRAKYRHQKPRPTMPSICSLEQLLKDYEDQRPQQRGKQTETSCSRYPIRCRQS